MSRRLYLVVSLRRKVHRTTKQSQEEPHRVAKPLWGTNYKPNSLEIHKNCQFVSHLNTESVLTSLHGTTRKSGRVYVLHTKIPCTEWVSTHDTNTWKVCIAINGEKTKRWLEKIKGPKATWGAQFVLTPKKLMIFESCIWWTHDPLQEEICN
jgi:hypothetical protein